jgi:alpha-L-rhamnosidase
MGLSETSNPRPTSELHPALAGHAPTGQRRTRPGCVRELVRRIRKNGPKIGTGFAGTPYILQVLEDHGHLDLAYELLEWEEFPSWLFPVTHGATTIWERWDGWHPERGFQSPGMNSFNHYAYGAVDEWMVRSVAGLVFETAGYQTIRFVTPSRRVHHRGLRISSIPIWQSGHPAARNEPGLSRG